jgi:aromatic-amino-acid transaminase
MQRFCVGVWDDFFCFSTIMNAPLKNFFPKFQTRPIDPIFALTRDFLEDERAKKINLGIGIYRDDEGRPFVFEAIKKAILELKTNDFEYRSMAGHLDFLEAAKALFLGSAKDLFFWAAQQTCGGTHACYLFGALMATGFSTRPKFLIATPTWPNHLGIWHDFSIETFSHLDDRGGVDFESYQRVMRRNPGSILVLHGGPTHNPTGRNLTRCQCEKLIEVANQNQIFLFVDFAYLGFGDGLEADRSWLDPFRLYAERLAIGVSFSKNAALYQHRLGALWIKTTNRADQKRIESNTQNIIRQTISNLPIFPAEVMHRVFESFFDLWTKELESVRQNIVDRRNQFLQALPSEYQRVKETRGLFAVLPLDAVLVEKLRQQYGIYLPSGARINFGGLFPRDISVLSAALQNLSQTQK